MDRFHHLEDNECLVNSDTTLIDTEAAMPQAGLPDVDPSQAPMIELDIVGSTINYSLIDHLDFIYDSNENIPNMYTVSAIMVNEDVNNVSSHVMHGFTSLANELLGELYVNRDRWRINTLSPPTVVDIGRFFIEII